MPSREPLAEALLAAGAVKFGRFTLTSGKQSDYYVNLKAAAAQPDLLRSLARAFAAHIPPEAGCIAGMELGAVPLAVATSLELGIPYTMIRKRARGHGTGSRVEGALAQTAVIVEDVATTGGSLVQAVDVLRELEVEVLGALVVVDREEGAGEALAQLGITLEPLLRISELMELRR